MDLTLDLTLQYVLRLLNLHSTVTYVPCRRGLDDQLEIVIVMRVKSVIPNIQRYIRRI